MKFCISDHCGLALGSQSHTQSKYTHHKTLDLRCLVWYLSVNAVKKKVKTESHVTDIMECDNWDLGGGIFDTKTLV